MQPLSARAAGSDDLHCPHWVTDSKHLTVMYSNAANRFIGPMSQRWIAYQRCKAKVYRLGKGKKEIIQAHHVIQKIREGRKSQSGSEIQSH